MAFSLVALLSNKKPGVSPEVRESLARAVRIHAPLELFEAPACGVRLRSGVFFNNISQNKVVLELDRYSCPRGLRKGLQALCSFTLHLAEDLWDYHKFETRIANVFQNQGRTSLMLHLPQDFLQRHTRNGQRLPIASDDSCALQAWKCKRELPRHLSQLMESTPLLQNGLRGNVRLLDISKGGMGLLLPDHGLNPAPEMTVGQELLFRLVLPQSARVEPLQCILGGSFVRNAARLDGHKAGVQFTRQAVLDQARSMRWHNLEDRGVLSLAELVRERCERLKAGPLR